MSDEYKKNCHFCVELGTDGEDEYTREGGFPVCEKMPGKDNLKSFPFKKEQKCHVPDFWRVMSVDKEISQLFNEEEHPECWSDGESWKLFEKKYKQESKNA